MFHYLYYNFYYLYHSINIVSDNLEDSISHTDNYSNYHPPSGRPGWAGAAPCVLGGRSGGACSPGPGGAAAGAGGLSALGRGVGVGLLGNSRGRGFCVYPAGSSVSFVVVGGPASRRRGCQETLR